MKIAEIRKLKTEELTVKSSELKAEIAELRRNLYGGQTTNVRSQRNKRKDYARLMTVLQERLSKEAV